MKRSLLIVLSLASLSSLASAQNYYDETRCRSVYSQNYAFACDRGTVTGHLDEIVIFRNCAGQEVSRQTIGWWRSRVNDPRVFDVVGHSNGQFSIRFNLYNFNAYLGGGSYEIQRAGKLIDRDMIY